MKLCINPASALSHCICICCLRRSEVPTEEPWLPSWINCSVNYVQASDLQLWQEDLVALGGITSNKNRLRVSELNSKRKMPGAVQLSRYQFALTHCAPHDRA
eukprot:s1781_g16.t1